MKKLVFLAGAFLTIISSCNSDEGGELPPNDWVKIELDGSTRAAAESLNDFYMSFTTDAVKYVDSDADGESKNVIVSPLSASMVLAMVANGVEEDVQKEITDYLGTNDLNSLNKLASVLLEELPKADNRTDMRLANSAWVNSKYKFTQEYTSLIQKNYLAETGSLDFSGNPNNAIDFLNGWCSRHTDGLIPKMFDHINPSTLAILINAMYFRGLWEDEYLFLPENTSKSIFRGMTKESNVDMMHASYDKRDYYSDENFQASALYFGNTSFSLWLLLPDESLTPEAANDLLAKNTFEEIVNKSESATVSIDVPKFKVENRYGLDGIFKTGGIEGLDTDVMFNMLEPASQGIMSFMQATSFEIDEDGVKAAAVTSNGLLSAPSLPKDKYSMKFDRPFYFFLRDKSTGAVLLSGRIADL